jgi:hypothetical protein
MGRNGDGEGDLRARHDLFFIDTDALRWADSRTKKELLAGGLQRAVGCLARLPQCERSVAQGTAVVHA